MSKPNYEKIIESGGTPQTQQYIKYSDGTMIICGNSTLQTTTWTKWGDMFQYEKTDMNLKYIVPFVSAPVVLVEIGDGSQSITGWISRTSSISKDYFNGFTTIRATDGQNGLLYFKFIAIGRWK